MSVPVINTTQSVLGFYQNEFFMFQPWATNMPTMWTSSPLPPGLSLNIATGLIQGQAFYPGVYVVSLYAANGDGASDPAIFTFGIEEGARGNDSDIELDLDVESGLVAVGGSNSSAGGAAGDTVAALFSVKNKDDMILAIQFTKREVDLTNLALSSLSLGLKERDGDDDLIIGSAFAEQGPGQYRLYVKLDAAALDSALEENENDDFPGTAFNALAEIKWVEEPFAPPDGFPAEVRRGSQTFLIQLVRNIVP